MRRLAHIINPVAVISRESDLLIAQPVTFATMTVACDFARGKVDVSLFTSQYPEDRNILPAAFRPTPDLEKSVLDLGSFRKSRKLPLIKDILDRLYSAAPDAEYMIYTNVDIALLPHFYLAVNAFIEEGHDAFVINRRTISKHYMRINEIPLMYADTGESHPGFDCFVFRRDSYPRFILEDVCIGANLVGTSLLFNLLCSSQKFTEFKDKHLTFHIGDDKSWKQELFSDFAAHNIEETYKVYMALEEKYGAIYREGRYLHLVKYLYDLKKELGKSVYRVRPEEGHKEVKEVQTRDESALVNNFSVAPQAADGMKTRIAGVQKGLCITGMARCGTSMLTKILNIMGLYLGPEDNLIMQTDYNVKGCWEHKGILGINDAIINVLDWERFEQAGWL